mgnify:CR=1 FL=1
MTLNDFIEQKKRGAEHLFFLRPDGKNIGYENEQRTWDDFITSALRECAEKTANYLLDQSLPIRIENFDMDTAVEVRRILKSRLADWIVGPEPQDPRA